jgi:hypothetical protein
MTGPQYPENSAADDEAWLDALAGRPAPSLNAKERAEVEHLRRAWANRKARLEGQLPEVDDDFVNRLLERREQDATKELEKFPPNTEYERRVQAVGEAIPAGPVSIERQIAANRPRFLWGMAASLFLAASLTTVMLVGQDDHDSYKSIDSPGRIELKVENFQASLVLFLTQVENRGIDCKVVHQGPREAIFECSQSFNFLSLIEEFGIEKPQHSGRVRLRIVEKG